MLREIIFQARTIADFRMGQGSGERDGVPMQIQDQRDTDFAAQIRETKSQREGYSSNRLRGIEITIKKTVPDGGPAQLAGKFYVESVAVENTRFLSDRKRCAINKRHVSDANGVGHGAPISGSSANFHALAHAVLNLFRKS